MYLSVRYTRGRNFNFSTFRWTRWRYIPLAFYNSTENKFLVWLDIDTLLLRWFRTKFLRRLRMIFTDLAPSEATIPSRKSTGVGLLRNIFSIISIFSSPPPSHYVFQTRNISRRQTRAALNDGREIQRSGEGLSRDDAGLV